jgi:GxxExxY protein
MKLDQKVEKVIKQVKNCAKKVFQELGPGWNEGIYQNAMEVALREEKIPYETQRILPITFADHVIGESIPDLVIWLKKGSIRTAVVIDLKWEPGIKEDHRVQVQRYIKELKKQIKSEEKVYETGYVINFIKAGSPKLKEEQFDHLCDGVQLLNVRVE